jgi:two-component sensor histidine kinase
VIKSIGRYADYLYFSKSAFFVFSFVSIVAVPITYRESSVDYLTLTTLTLGIISTFLLYPPFLLIISLQKHDFSNTFLFKGSALIGLGVLRGVLIFSGADFFSLEQPVELASRILNSTLTTIVWLGLLSVLIEVSSRYKRRYLAIISQLLISNIMEQKGPEKSFALVADEMLQLQSALKGSYSRALEDPILREGASRASTEIFQQLENILKPVTINIWNNSLTSVPTFKVLTLIKISVFEFYLNLKLALPIFFLTSVINYSATFGLRAGFEISLFGTVLIFLAEVTRRKTEKIFSQFQSVLNTLFLPCSGFLIVYLSFFLTSDVAFKEMYPYVILLGSFLTGIFLLFSILGHATKARAIVMERLVAEVDDKQQFRNRFQTASSSNDFQLASYLHNSLQSELMAIAYELSEAAQNPSQRRIDTAMERFSSVIGKSLQSDFAEYLESPKERYEKIIDSWSSIVSISLKVDASIFLDASRASVFVQFVQESIANAVRSGRATEISITGFYSEGIFKVAIEDNGKGRSSNRAGIGKTWIERVTISTWKLSSNDEGSKLTVEF